MKIRYLIPLLGFCCNASWADFSDTRMGFHPLYIDYVDNEPFILDFRGEWPTDCHPGEQKPIIREYTGDSVLIEFEIIVEHPLCNETPTPYRVLVDMSDAVDEVPGEFPLIDVTMRFGGAERVYELEKVCGLRCDPPPPPQDIKPEPGVYFSNGLEKQGLLIARQNQGMGVYPLVYDEAGSSEWLLGAGGIVEDVFFAELLEFTGGQCLGCMPPDELPQVDAVGKITMLMDSEGVLQVKVDDGLFETYESLDFSYGSFNVGGYPPRRIADLTGRWAIVSDSHLGIIPMVFDIALVSVTTTPTPIGGTPPPTPPGNVLFSVRDRGETEVGELKCEIGGEYEAYDGALVCFFNSADSNGELPMFQVEMLSLERLSFDWRGPVVTAPTLWGIAVRID